MGSAAMFCIAGRDVHSYTNYCCREVMKNEFFQCVSIYLPFA